MTTDPEIAVLAAIRQFFKATTDPRARERVIQYAASLADSAYCRDVCIARSLCAALYFGPLITKRSRHAAR